MSLLSAGALAAMIAAAPFNPPIQYLGYEPVHVIEVDVRDATGVCADLRKIALGDSYEPLPFDTLLAGCQTWGHLPGGGYTTEDTCVIVIPNLWSLSGNKALQECVYNHEWAHCGGWPQGHPGQQLCDH